MIDWDFVWRVFIANCVLGVIGCVCSLVLSTLCFVAYAIFLMPKEQLETPKDDKPDPKISVFITPPEYIRAAEKKMAETANGKI